MFRRCACLVAAVTLAWMLVWVMVVQAQDVKNANPPVDPTRVPGGFASILQRTYASAVMDLASLPESDRPFTRYVWIWTGKVEDLKVVSLTVNMVSRSPILYRPLVLQADDFLLARIDLRRYCPTDKDLKEWLQLWEELQFDPKFSVLLTKDTIKALLSSGTELPKMHKRVSERHQVGTRKIKKSVPVYTATDGKTYDYQFVDEPIYTEAGSWTEVAIENAEEVDVVRFSSEAIDPKLTLHLIELTGSQAPVVSHDYFVSRLLSTIKDGRPVQVQKEDKIYQTIYGGLYYEFSGTPLAGDKGTDEDAFFEQLGIGNVQAGITARSIYDKIRSDRRAAMFSSLVTKKPRQAEFLRVPGGARVGDGVGIVSITHDPFDEDMDVNQNPVMNLLAYIGKDRAREVIYERANGLQGYLLFDGKGKRQNEVPFNVAMDHTIPNGYTKRLQPAIGCIRCHGPHDGWMPFPNDVRTTVRSKKGPDALIDLSDPKKTTNETLDRLNGLYEGEPEPFLQQARDLYMKSFLRATGPWAEGAKDQTEVVKVGSERIATVWGNRWYKDVNSASALRELGISAEKGKELDTFNSLLLPEFKSQVFGVIPEDVRIGGIKAGHSVTRRDFDLVYGFLSARVSRSGGKQRGIGK